MELLEAEPQLGSAPEPTHTSVPTPYDKRLMVFAGRGSQELGHKIAGKLGLALGQVELKTFSNGEVYCRYQESIRGADVFIVQSTHGGAPDRPRDRKVAIVVHLPDPPLARDDGVGKAGNVEHGKRDDSPHAVV